MTLIFLTLSVVLNTLSLILLSLATYNNTKAIRNLIK